MVKRYELEEGDCVEDTGLVEDDFGYWVEYPDYAALEARVAELEMELRDTEYYSDMLVKHNIELESRLAELEKDAAMWSYVKSIHTDGWVSEVEDRASRES